MLYNEAVFGALGNGSTDEPPKAQAAINHTIANGKGGVYLPPDEYRGDRTPHIDKHIDHKRMLLPSA